MREIRAEFGRDVRIERVSADLGRVAGPPVEDLARACDAGRIMFVRHLTTEIASFSPDELPPGYELAELILEELRDYPKALGRAGLDRQRGTGGSYYHLLQDALADRGVTVTRSGQEVVVSCFAGRRAVLLGLNRLEFSLSDWPGGRMRLAVGGAGVAVGFQAGGGDRDLRAGAAAGGKALDLGAAGWLDPDLCGSTGRRCGRWTPARWTRGCAATGGSTTWRRRPGGSSRQPGAVRRGGERHADGPGDECPDDARRRPRTCAAAGWRVVTLKGGGKNPLEGARRGWTCCAGVRRTARAATAPQPQRDHRDGPEALRTHEEAPGVIPGACSRPYTEESCWSADDALDLAGLDAGRADLHAGRGALDERPDRLDVGVEPPGRTSLDPADHRALPKRATLLPTVGCLPQTSHFLDMILRVQGLDTDRPCYMRADARPIGPAGPS